MANNGKFLVESAGDIDEENALDVSAGAGDGSKIFKTKADGRWDPSLMPTGFVLEAVAVTTSEALAAGDLVNIFDSGGGVARARKADAVPAGREADGFVITSFGSGVLATIFIEGANTAASGLTPGAQQFLSETAGLTTETAPAANRTVQKIGKAVSATEYIFEPASPIRRAP